MSIVNKPTNKYTGFMKLTTPKFGFASARPRTNLAATQMMVDPVYPGTATGRVDGI